MPKVLQYIRCSQIIFYNPPPHTHFSLSSQLWDLKFKIQFAFVHWCWRQDKKEFVSDPSAYFLNNQQTRQKMSESLPNNDIFPRIYCAKSSPSLPWFNCCFSSNMVPHLILQVGASFPLSCQSYGCPVSCSWEVGISFKHVDHENPLFLKSNHQIGSLFLHGSQAEENSNNQSPSSSPSTYVFSVQKWLGWTSTHIGRWYLHLFEQGLLVAILSPQNFWFEFKDPNLI